MTYRLLVLLFLAASLATLLAGERNDSHAGWKVPEKDAARANPLSGSPEMATGGGKIFARRCASCHAEDGRGSGKAPNLRSAAVQEQSDGELFWKITNGNARHGMPPFSSLPEKQRWQIVLFLRTLSDVPKK